MERQFDIMMHVPLGGRRGRLSFAQTGNDICGILEVLGCAEPFAGTLDADGLLELKGQIKTLLHTFAYMASGRIEEGMLWLEVSSPSYTFLITGTEVKA